MCWSRAAHTLDTHRTMHAFLALAFALAVSAHADPRDRFGYDREIASTRHNQVPKLLDYTLNEDNLAAQKNRAKLITKPISDHAVAADTVLVESNWLSIVRPSKREVISESSDTLVRRRRGYNLENVRVPARYPYLPVPSYNRFRRWG